MADRARRLEWAGLLALALAACHPAPSPTPAPAPEGPTLEGWAVLPADSFAAGPPSGARLSPKQTHGRPVPFPGQPMQGFSALLPEGDGGWLALTDNGYGAPENSDDFLLRAYHLAPDFAAHQMKATVAFTLSDPERQLPFTLVRELLGDRQLTGADLDPESIQRAGDGTYWIGEELGPYLVHVDAQGRVLEPPVELRAPAEDGGCEALRAPTSPAYEEASVLRLAQALRAHAAANGGPAPLVSPDHLMIADGRADTVLPGRKQAEAYRPTATVAAGRETLDVFGEVRPSSELVDVAQLKRAGFDTLPWTVNHPVRMKELIALGVTGLISDRPDLLRVVADEADGGVEVEGHRGARGLRPENTLPAFEAGLDVGADALETDVHLTADGVTVLWHDHLLPRDKCRPLKPGAPKEPVIREATLEQLRGYACDVLQGRFPEQRNAPDLSPVAVAFARERRLRTPYAIATLDDLFDFVDYYGGYYAKGAGRALPDAARRAATAAKVRFNLETKVNPRRSQRAVSPDPVLLTRALLSRVVARGLIDRATLESFDLETLLQAQREVPRLRTVVLLDDEPELPLVGDGTNLAPEDGRSSPFLAGLRWPYRSTVAQCPPRVQQSGGFEALGRFPGTGVLLPTFEKPVAGAGVLALAWDPATHRATGARWRLELPSGAASLTDLQLTSPTTGLALVRDGSQGRLDGVKQVVRFALPEGGGVVQLEPLVNLLRLRAPGLAPVPGDLGVGDPFAFPFVTTEALWVLAPHRLVLANDNNYPFSVGRHLAAGHPDDDELIVIGY